MGFTSDRNISTHQVGKTDLKLKLKNNLTKIFKIEGKRDFAHVFVSRDCAHVFVTYMCVRDRKTDIRTDEQTDIITNRQTEAFNY